MRKTIIIVGVIILIAMLTIFPAISTYNGLVSSNQNVKAAWSQVEIVYQRRLDLIPNLVNTVKGAANYEKSTLTQVIEARAKATQVTIDPTRMTAENMKQFQEAQGQVSSALSRLMVSVERYPDLKANQGFMNLQAQIEGTENRIAFERKNFNDVVVDYNNKVTRFPGNMFANMFGFKEKPYFAADKAAEKAPSVQF